MSKSFNRDSAMALESPPNDFSNGKVEEGLSVSTGQASRGLRSGFALSLGGITAFWLILMSIFASYPTDLGDAHVQQYYHYLSGVLVMLLLGFGFLMTFLRRYSMTAVSLNFVLTAMMMIGSLVCMGFQHEGFGKYEITVPLLVDAAFCAAAGLIAFGVVIGVASPTQLVWLLTALVPLYACVFQLVIRTIGTFDVGGSITIHALGAAYGLGASYFVTRANNKTGSLLSAHPKNGSNPTSDVFSMIGTTLLWVYWPSFNAALASADVDYRIGAGLDEPQHQIFVVCNTLISLLGACVATFVMSAYLNDGLDAVHIQNATLAGGVAIGTSSALRIAPGAALGVGIIAGTLSTLGFSFATPWLERTLSISDSCGVLNLHGMPGVLGGIVSAFFTGIYYDENKDILTDYSQSKQAGLQIAGTAATVAIGAVAGLVVGWIVTTVKVPKLCREASDGAGNDDLFEDEAVFKLE